MKRLWSAAILAARFCGLEARAPRRYTCPMPVDHPVRQPPTEAPDNISLQQRAIRAFGYSWITLFILALPAISLWTDELNRAAWRFHVGHYLMALLLITALAVPLAALWLGVDVASSRKDSRLFRFVRRAAVALPLSAGASTLFGLGTAPLEAFTITFYNEIGWAPLIFLVLLLLPSIHKFGRKAGFVVARLAAFLPVVLLLWFAPIQTPQMRMDPLPQEPASAPRDAGPVYFFLFDAWDRKTTLANLDRLPVMARCMDEFTWFPDSVVSHHSTVYTLPSILWQQPGRAGLDSERRWRFQHDDEVVYLAETPTVLEMLAGPDEHKIVAGFHVEFGKHFDGRQGVVVREYPFIHPLPDASLRMKAHSMLQQFVHLAYWPSMRQRSSFNLDWVETMSHALHDDALHMIERGGDGVVGFFHLVWPHDPFMYDRDGRLSRKETEGRTDEEAYLGNLEYTDRKLGELLEAMKAAGVYDRATVVLLGDHGYPYEQQPPLLIKLPGQTEGRVVNESVTTHGIVEWLHRQSEFAAGRPPR